MKFFIPELGVKIKLKKKWTFNLYLERRNESLYKDFAANSKKHYQLEGEIDNDYYAKYAAVENRFTIPWRENKEIVALVEERNQKRKDLAKLFIQSYTFPKNTILIVDRIYIRAGAEEFSSLTFKIPSIKRGRFWAKLEDIHNMEFDIING